MRRDRAEASRPQSLSVYPLNRKMKATGDSPSSNPERKSTLIEFPGISRSSVTQWRKELSEKVREVQERRAREAAREAAEAERQRVEAASNPPQLELLPPTETPAMNPLVAAALKRIERAHQSASVETGSPRSSLATAVAYAPEREENSMNQTVPPTIQLDFEPEPPAAEITAPVEDVRIADTAGVAPASLGSGNNLRQHADDAPVIQARLSIVPPPNEPAAVKTELPQLPKRLIRDDPNDPALNYLDSICRNVRVDDLATTSASVFRRAVSAVLDLIFCVLLTSPIAGAVYLTGNLDVYDTRVLTLLDKHDIGWHVAHGDVEAARVEADHAPRPLHHAPEHAQQLAPRHREGFALQQLAKHYAIAAQQGTG